MKDSWPEARDVLFEVEGFDANIHGDPGGRTRLGVSEKWFPHEYALIAAMNETDAKAYASEFYRVKFWNVIKGDSLPHPLDVCAFVEAVNQGTGPDEKFIEATRATDQWRDFLFMCFQRYVDLWNAAVEKGWDRRLLTLWARYYHKA